MTDRLDGPCALHGMYGCCSWCQPIETDESDSVARGHQDLSAGRSASFDTVDDLIDDLSGVSQQEVRQDMGSAYRRNYLRTGSVQTGLINKA